MAVTKLRELSRDAKSYAYELGNGEGIRLSIVTYDETVKGGQKGQC